MVKTHGKYYTPENRAWAAMRKRCLNPACHNYEYYGGRGITICKRWDRFENFLEDMGERPSPNHSLDRIDVDGNYEPTNCRWADKLTQMNNTRRTLRYQNKTLREWSEQLGIKYYAFQSAVQRYKSLDRAVEVYKLKKGKV